MLFPHPSSLLLPFSLFCKGARTAAANVDEEEEEANVDGEAGLNAATNVGEKREPSA